MEKKITFYLINVFSHFDTDTIIEYNHLTIFLQFFPQ